jgi:hypothetical protein
MSTLICEEAEQHVLAAFCQGQDMDLRPELFAGIGHVQLVGLLVEGRPASLEALLGRLLSVGVPADLARGLATACFAPVVYDPAVLQQVKELAARRHLAQVTVEELARAARSPGSLLEAVREAMLPVTDILAEDVQGGAGLAPLIDWTRRRFEGEQYGYRASWPLLEKIFGPLAHDRLFVLAGPRKIGKSIWALSLALDIAQQGGSVLFNAIDMGEERTFLRLVSVLTGLPFTKLWRNECSAVEKQVFEEATGMLEKLPFQVVHMSDIKKFGRMAKGVDMAVVDYLQMCTAGSWQSKTEEVTAVVGELKEQSHNHFTLAVSQLSRGGDYLWSGAIEQMGDIIARLHSESKRVIVLNIEYHRDGPIARIPYFMFHEVEMAIELPELPAMEIMVGGE